MDRRYLKRNKYPDKERIDNIFEKSNRQYIDTIFQKEFCLFLPIPFEPSFSGKKVIPGTITTANLSLKFFEKGKEKETHKSKSNKQNHGKTRERYEQKRTEREQ